jgi:hypothetical protein
MIVQALVCIILYYQLGNDAFSKIQNTAGCIFFMTLTPTFTGIVANLHGFNG